MDNLLFAERLRSIIVRAQKHHQSRDDVLIELSFMMDEYEDEFEKQERQMMLSQGVYA